MTEPNGLQPGEKLYATLTDDHVTLDDVLPVLERIATALEAQLRPTRCGTRHNDAGPACVLDDRHVGYHASADGRIHWLDED